MSKFAILREFAAVRWLRPLRTRTAVERRQRRLLRSHVAFLRRRSPYFGGMLATRSFADLPLMDKSVMMSRFDEINTVGVGKDEALALAIRNERSRDFEADLGSHSVGLSSGTSGHRGLFVVSSAERDAWVGTVLARTLPRGRIFGHRIALFLRADNSLYESVGSRVVSFRYFDVYSDMDDNIARLQEYRPTILVAPPSVLRLIARAADAGAFDVVPQRVYSVAEVLEIADEQRIRDSLGQPLLHQLYQCTEGFLAHTCEHGVIHLNEDNILVEREALDDERFTPIVTDLRRRAQPIVRYRLGDVLRQRLEPCPCGSALTAIERIEGREGDTLVFRGLDGRAVPVFADVITRALLYADGFDEYRITQIGESRLQIALDTVDDRSRRRVEAEVGALADRLACERPDLMFVDFVRDGSVKLRRVVQEWGDRRW
ncbi:F390 synthetase-related protein [Microbacterium phyllosphaerae]|uniref:F390 synthetase-related protein n=1 Tax=Microbacterium phyllosphaerae TaxID=124798 RepID=UPI002167B3DA|nr:F390 synthetase-related protein [Microbacterium phyllosphaerae]MCS3444260.1 putative adenylate-forming enzyme [Microbacterium phyllosphaerae]